MGSNKLMKNIIKILSYNFYNLYNHCKILEHYIIY